MKKIVSEETLLRFLEQYSKQTVTVLGDVGVDRYTQGSVERISPEAPVPIVLVQHETFKLGLAANVADNILALGGSARLMGVLGKDEDAKVFQRLIAERKLKDDGLVVDSGRRTILKERIVAETQQMLRIDYESQHEMPQSIRTRVKKSTLQAIKKSDALIIEDYAKGLLDQSTIRTAIQAAQKRNIPILVDPHLKTPVEWYAGATLLTPNKREAESLSGVRIVDAASLELAGAIILKKAQAQSLIITLGGSGMAIFQADANRKSQNKIPAKNKKISPLRMPTFAKEVYDVSGAGDTVISVLALTLASGSTLEEAAFISNLAAGVEVGKRGTATVTPQEIVAAYVSELKNTK
jgi:rfaE bifunctional protein kinase chain/domain